MSTRLHAGDDITGSGIGLAVCRKIVERQGEMIWIEDPDSIGSEAPAEVGCVVKFTIPRVKQDGNGGSARILDLTRRQSRKTPLPNDPRWLVSRVKR